MRRPYVPTQSVGQTQCPAYSYQGTYLGSGVPEMSWVPHAVCLQLICRTVGEIDNTMQLTPFTTIHKTVHAYHSMYNTYTTPHLNRICLEFTT